MPEVYAFGRFVATADPSALGVIYALNEGTPEWGAAFGEFDLDETIDAAARPRTGRPQWAGIEIDVGGRLVAISDLVQSWSVKRSIDAPKQAWSFVVALNSPSGVFGNIFETLGSPIGLDEVDVYGVLVTSTGIHRIPLITGGIVDDPGTVRIGRNGYTQSFSGTDRGGRFDGKLVDMVLGPGHGFRRDQMGQKLMTAAGETRFKLTAQGGPSYKEFQVADGEAIGRTQDLWDTDGARVNWTPDGYFSNPRIGPPDESSALYTLTEQDILAVAEVVISPPHDPPTSITILGSEQKVQEGACGLVNPPALVTKLRGVGDPVYMTQLQDATGALTPQSVPSPTTTVRDQQVTIFTRILRCGVVLYERTEKREMKNEQAARYRYQVTGSTAISSLTLSGQTVTATVASTSGLAELDVLHVSGADQPEYNGSFPVRIVDATHFTYTIVGSPVSPATGGIIYAGVTRHFVNGVYLGDDAAVGPNDSAAAFFRRHQDLIPTSIVETWNVYNRPGFATVPAIPGVMGEAVATAYSKLRVDADWAAGSKRDGILLGSITKTQTPYIYKASLKKVTTGTAIDATAYTVDRYILGSGEGVHAGGFGLYERLQETQLEVETVTPAVEDDGEISYEESRTRLAKKWYARPGTEFWYAGGAYSRDEVEVYEHYSTDSKSYVKTQGVNGHTFFFSLVDSNGQALGDASNNGSQNRDGYPPAIERLGKDENPSTLYGTTDEADQKREAQRGDLATIEVTVTGTDLLARYREKNIRINLPYIENQEDALRAARLALAEGASKVITFVTSANFLLAYVPAITLKVRPAGLDKVVAIRELEFSGGVGQPILTSVNCREYPIAAL